MATTDQRNRLAAQQAQLLEVLMKMGNQLRGVNTHHLQAAAESLMNKRLRAAARAWPELARALGASWEELFLRYAKQSLLPHGGGPLADGRAFADFLKSQGKLPEEARLEVLAFDVRFLRSPRGLRRRRGPALKMAFLKEARRLVTAVRLPLLGERWFWLALGKGR